MNGDTTVLRGARAALFLVFALGAGVLLACETQAPDEGAEADASRRAEVPGFIPYDVAPELQNAVEVSARLQELYPDSLEEAGTGGSVVLWLLVDDRGRVQKSLLQETSGYDALDQAASRIASEMDFSPALNRNERVGVWVQQRIRFEPDTTES